jgi:hypothetical protein
MGVGTTIKMSKTQLMHNANVEGGFIGALLPMLATAGRFLLSSVLPTVATGLLSGVGQAAGATAVNKIAGNGVMYIKKNGMGAKIQTDGHGLYSVAMAKRKFAWRRHVHQKRIWIQSIGAGLLLGPNSPFQKIPILGMIL